jgi:hypothetical protein
MYLINRCSKKWPLREKLRDTNGYIILPVREQKKLIAELQEALASIKTLKGLLPICASCKKVRDDKGYWNQIEVYIRERSDAEFSHGLCPDCAQRYYDQLALMKAKR